MNLYKIVYKGNGTEMVMADKYEKQGCDYVFLIETYEKGEYGIVKRVPEYDVKKIEEM